MRKFKFRVWASNSNHPGGAMFYPGDGSFAITLFGDLIHNHTNNMHDGFAWARIAFNEIEVMQYVGLKDKNGEEIYEGDLLSLHGGAKPVIGEVIFEYGCFCFKAPWIGEGNHYPELKYYIEVEFVECEVIGNIYENPELVKEVSDG